MADISSSFLGDSTVERAVPRSLEEDMSMGDMSFADLANLSSEQNEDEGVEVNEAADPTLIPGLATSSTEVRPNAANDTTSISSTGPDLHNEQITELRHNIEELKDELESLKREYDAQQAELQQTMAKSIEPLDATISGHSLHIAELQEDVCTAKTMVTAQRNETQRLTARLEAAEGAAQEARDLADKRDEDIRDLRNTGQSHLAAYLFASLALEPASIHEWTDRQSPSSRSECALYPLPPQLQQQKQRQPHLLSLLSLLSVYSSPCASTLHTQP